MYIGPCWAERPIDAQCMPPRISLITPSYQQAEYLKECLASVHGQDYPDLEHIVVDGGSTDGSAAIIEDHSDRLAWWCSERDRGQSHAINKGLQHATGEVFGWLNSDDLLLPGALKAVGEAFERDPTLLVFGGRRLIRGVDGSEVPSPLDDASDRERLFAAPCINQQSTFYRMDVVRAAEGVDEALHYTMDLELWWRILFANGSEHLRFIPQDLAVFRFHADSKTVKDQHHFQEETAAILHQLAKATNQLDLVAVLAQGYKVERSLRGINAEPGHADIVRAMVVHFLLKWNGEVHTRRQFEMMRSFRRTVSLEGLHLGLALEQRVKELDAQLDVPGWAAFRLKRKLRYWGV